MARFAEFLNLLNRRDHDIDYAYTSRITPTADAGIHRRFPPRRTVSGAIRVTKNLLTATNMGRICYFDAFSGMSGDMTVGALVDAGADPTAVIQTLESLGIDSSFEFAKVKRRGIGATRFRVTVIESNRHRHLPRSSK